MATDSTGRLDYDFARYTGSRRTAIHQAGPAYLCNRFQRANGQVMRSRRRAGESDCLLAGWGVFRIRRTHDDVLSGTGRSDQRPGNGTGCHCRSGHWRREPGRWRRIDPGQSGGSHHYDGHPGGQSAERLADLGHAGGNRRNHCSCGSGGSNPASPG